MYDFDKIEKEARKVWKKHSKEIDKAVHEIQGRPLFSFLEGPPTANAPPALHHLEVRTYKDIINKFKFMNGFSVPRKGGWDCHGLPVEVQVEKNLGLKDKKAVIKYGVGKFIEKARDSVFSNIKDWNKSTEELDYWIDLKNPYITLNNNYIESVWWSLKELYKKKMLYEGHKVVHFCPRCGTPLSSHEVAQGYKDVTEESVYVAFKVKGKKDEYILAWTTTPWTLPGNVALAVGKNIKYVEAQLEEGDKVILAKNRLKILRGKFKILREMKGNELVGMEYEPLYKIKELDNGKSYHVIPANFVTTDDGTGIVHTAVMYGEEDYEVGIKAGLPAAHTVGEDGKFLNIVPKFIRGKFVKSAEKDIIQDLKKRRLLFKTEKITHSYPFCWRCGTPLLYYAIDSWFVKVSAIRDKMLKLNKEINWEPEHIKNGRFGNWLEGARDWALSRFKFWGTPLPVWKCKCGEVKVIGSIEEMEKNAVKIPKGKLDLHKPWIDKVKLKCPSCNEEMERVSDVIDCWYDSGSASFAQFHYPFENKKEFEKRFPYDFVAEAIDQTRGWFYTLHVLATILFDKPAYKNVICAGHIVDENGEKMSKSKGNVISPEEIINKTGVDAVRLQFCTSDAGNQKRFSLGLMKESVMPFLNILYNINKYYGQMEDKKGSRKIEDKWILSRLNSTIIEVTKGLNDFKLYAPLQSMMDFVVRDLSRGYIQMTREREDTKKIIGECLEKISLVLAPFAPYITEYVHRNFSENSVHLSEWPKSDNKIIDKTLEERFRILLKMIEFGLRERDKTGIGLKWPLPQVTIYMKGRENFLEFESLIKSQLNIKKIEWKSPTSKETEFELELDTNLTPELEAEGYAREVSRQVQAFRKKLGLNKSQKVETIIIVDKGFSDVLEGQKDYIKGRTNSNVLRIVTSDKETFKNIIDLRVRDKRGKIAIIVTKR